MKGVEIKMAELEVYDDVLTVSQVARIFNVHPKTVNRWGKEGRLPVAFKTPGGHFRFYRKDVRAQMGVKS